MDVKDQIPNIEIPTKAHIQSIFTIIMHSQLRWAGHVCRRNNNGYSTGSFKAGSVERGKRSKVGQKLKNKDKSKAFNINQDSWDTACQDRTAWRMRTYAGTKAYAKYNRENTQLNKTAR